MRCVPSAVARDFILITPPLREGLHRLVRLLPHGHP